jgi:hypothetical protein
VTWTFAKYSPIMRLDKMIGSNLAQSGTPPVDGIFMEVLRFHLINSEPCTHNRRLPAIPQSATRKSS